MFLILILMGVALTVSLIGDSILIRYLPDEPQVCRVER
jgi:hypothetical protein